MKQDTDVLKWFMIYDVELGPLYAMERSDRKLDIVRSFRYEHLDLLQVSSFQALEQRHALSVTNIAQRTACPILQMLYNFTC